MLNNKKIVFEKPWELRLQTEDIDENAVPAGHVLLKKRYSLVSTGTELACLSGNESWFAMPGIAGYMCAGEVLKTGEGVKDISPGELFFCYGNHSLYQAFPVNGIFIRVPGGLDPRWAPFVRMASIAATASRVSDIEWGDYAAVTGQGLVGNLAMQFARLQGARVIAIDIADKRLEAARQCGADFTINSAREDVAEKIGAITAGSMVSTLIEATGVPAVAAKAAEWIAQNGELILLGSPRGDYQTDLTPFLNRVHLAASNLTLKGAHEWRFPVKKTPLVKHSFERNSELIINLILQKRLMMEPLLSEIASPSDCASVYAGLRDNKDKYMGVLFDWSK